MIRVQAKNVVLSKDFGTCKLNTPPMSFFKKGISIQIQSFGENTTTSRPLTLPYLIETDIFNSINTYRVEWYRKEIWINNSNHWSNIDFLMSKKQHVMYFWVRWLEPSCLLPSFVFCLFTFLAFFFFKMSQNKCINDKFIE